MDLILALVALRDIAAGEELTIDYALFLADPGFAMACRCPAAAGRGLVRGTDCLRAGVIPGYRWRLRGDLQGVPWKPPGVVGGSAQVFLAAPYRIWTRAAGKTAADGPTAGGRTAGHASQS